jgi:hypothetical protein
VGDTTPVITHITGPTVPVTIGSSVTIGIDYQAVGSSDAHLLYLDWGDGSTNAFAPALAGHATASHAYATAGVYTVSVQFADGDGGLATGKFEYVVVYDSEGGFVTGGGWIPSPAGVYSLDPAANGRATFGFIAKYQKGANVPSGSTQFQLHFANFMFKSQHYEWLVVSGAKAQYKGTGTINGAGNYGFLLTATDGQAGNGEGTDKFRIKIWDPTTGEKIYDNVPSGADDLDNATPQALGGGNILIHK